VLSKLNDQMTGGRKLVGGTGESQLCYTAIVEKGGPHPAGDAFAV
jgi:hypothetical protein